jgi:redox-sensitive bicupin YhaK (pirin superfamily)
LNLFASFLHQNCMTTTELKSRSVARSFSSVRTLEGDGVEIGRAFPTQHLEDIDPFLLLDHMGPIKIEPGEDVGFPDHPHRGFETVTYLLEGQMEHRDSFGNRGLLEAGDIQWMTAGSGLVHSEMPARELLRKGGRLEGFQLWVNLPRRDKMTPPRYQELKSAAIPHAVTATGDVQVRVIAGESLGTGGAIQSRTPILYLHLTLAPGATHVQALPENFNAFAFVIRGKLQFQALPAFEDEGRVVVFAKDGDAISISNPSGEPAQLLLIAGEPIGEPVERYGPFVMNTRQEVAQAFRDFREGKMGAISAS